MKDYIVFTINSNKQTAKDFAKFWNCQLGKTVIKKFADGETLVKVSTDVKDKDVIVIESIAKKPNDKIIEILMLLDSINRCSPRSVTLIIPYLGYSRQERVNEEFEPISSQIVAKALETGSYNKLIVLDLHHPDVCKFFTRGIKNVQTTKIFYNYFNNYLKEHNYNTSNLVVVSPDHGANSRSDSLIFHFRGAKKVTCEKIRSEPDHIKTVKLNGDVKDKVCIVIDDIISTGNTIVNVVKLLKKGGAKAILVGATHGLFSADSVANIKKAGADKIVVTNSIEQKLDGIDVIDIVQLLIENVE